MSTSINVWERWTEARVHPPKTDFRPLEGKVAQGGVLSLTPGHTPPCRGKSDFGRGVFLSSSPTVCCIGLLFYETEQTQADTKHTLTLCLLPFVAPGLHQVVEAACQGPLCPPQEGWSRAGRQG